MFNKWIPKGSRLSFHCEIQLVYLDEKNSQAGFAWLGQYVLQCGIDIIPALCSQDCCPIFKKPNTVSLLFYC